MRYPTIDDTAHRLGIPVRTLQRRLKESGLSYSRLVEQTRHELACRLLDKPDAKASRSRQGARLQRSQQFQPGVSSLDRYVAESLPAPRLVATAVSLAATL